MSDLNAFASEMSFEEYYCAHVFFGMTSKTLHVSGLKTESEFPDVYLDLSGNMVSHLHCNMIIPVQKVVNVSDK